MSSALLYLAIVGVWIAVLVPMWLRREHTGHFFTRRRPMSEPDDDTYDEDISHTTAHDIVRDAETETVIDDGHTTPTRPAHPPGVRPRRNPATARRRAKIIARRRRRTTILLTLLIATTTLAATHVTPWWIVPIPALLLVGHLALLRAAAADDAQRARIEAARHRAARARRTTEDTAVESTVIAPTAEIIDLASHTREEIYDQYADAEKRAVND